MNCKLVKRKMERLVFGGLRDTEAASIRAHLGSCLTCSAEHERYQQLKAGLERDRITVALPAHAGELILPERTPGRPVRRWVWAPIAAAACTVAIAALLFQPKPQPPVRTVGAPKTIAPGPAPKLPMVIEKPAAVPRRVMVKRWAEPRRLHDQFRQRKTGVPQLVVQHPEPAPPSAMEPQPREGWSMRIEAIDVETNARLVLCRSVDVDGREESARVGSSIKDAKGDM